jgi:hypothetical protein
MVAIPSRPFERNNMKKSVYLVSGDNVPTKLAVVAFELEHGTLLEIENRFRTDGGYTDLTPVHNGVVRLATPVFGHHDQAYFPGYDSFRLESEGGTNSRPSDSEQGMVIPMEEGEYTSRSAFLLERTAEGVTENLVIVMEDSDQATAKNLAQAFAGLPGVATLDVKRIGSGTFQVAPEVAAKGFRVRVAPVRHY